MSEQDLKKFIHKVEHLNNLIQSINTSPKRRAELVACSSHEEVINLAKSWGFEIGKRWGDKD